MRFLFTQIGFVFCSVLTSYASDLPDWIRQSRPSNAPILTIPAFKRINESLQKKGTVKLIVRLAPPSGLSGGFAIEGQLESPDAITRQRAHIAGVQGKVSALLSKQHADRTKKFDFIPYMALDATPSEFEALATSADIEHIEEDVPFPPALSQSVPLVGAIGGSFNGFSGSGQTVAILDTGVDRAHPFLSGKVIAEACYSTTDSTAKAVCATGSTAPGAGANCSEITLGSDCTHGTHVAGIVAGKNGTFSAVAKDANLISVQVFSQFPKESCGAGATGPCVMSYTSDQIKGLNYVYNLRGTFSISSVNMSLGGGSYTSNCDSNYTAEKAAIDALRSVGIATVIASGNDGYTSSISAPACISTAISVGATTKADAIASYSNSALLLKLLAPGSSIYSSIPGGSYSTKSGTSMATPHVAGAWAVLKSAKPSASVDEILAALASTGKLITDIRIGAPGTITKPRIKLDSAVLVLKPPTAPSSATVSASLVTSNSATLNGIVNENRSATSVSFDHGTSVFYGANVSATIGGNISAGMGATNSSVVLSSLTCNSTYHFRVKATNSYGTSYGSDRTFTTTACPPGTPAITSVAAGNSRATVYFSPPVSDGGSRIISYTVTPSSGLPVSGDTVPIVVTGLANGTPYTFTVKATNIAGTGPASAASAVVTPGVAVIDDAHETAYQLLQSAYETDSSGEEIKLLANANVGDLAVNSSNAKEGVTITIKGGYNNTFTDDDGLPSILGKVTLSAGKTGFQNVIVRVK